MHFYLDSPVQDCFYGKNEDRNLKKDRNESNKDLYLKKNIFCCAIPYCTSEKEQET